MSRLERWIEFENRSWAALVTDAGDHAEYWADLVRRTAPHVIEGRPFAPRWEANSAFTPSTITTYYLPDGHPLAVEWAGYRDRWEAFLDRNPRCRIAVMMSDVSERYDACSFPYGYEHAVQTWVRSGFTAAPPVPYLEGLATPEWQARFAAAADAAPDGWVYYDGDGLEGRYVWR